MGTLRQSAPGLMPGLMPGLVLRPMGESAVLAELPDARSALALYTRLRPDPAGPPSLPGAVDVVPAERTVLVTFDAAVVGAAAVGRWLRAARVAAEEAARATEAARADRAARAGGAGADHDIGPDPGHEPGSVVELAAHYDGADLAEVAGTLGLTVDALIDAHTATRWTAAFIGFAPGFAYLRSEDDDVERLLDLPRRPRPRSVVPAGSVALAAGYCGVYPRESPGGWHLIGRTAARLWDADRPDPALLAPGSRVRFTRAG